MVLTDRFVNKHCQQGNGGITPLPLPRTAIGPKVASSLVAARTVSSAAAAREGSVVLLHEAAIPVGYLVRAVQRGRAVGVALDVTPELELEPLETVQHVLVEVGERSRVGVDAVLFEAFHRVENGLKLFSRLAAFAQRIPQLADLTGARSELTLVLTNLLGRETAGVAAGCTPVPRVARTIADPSVVATAAAPVVDVAALLTLLAALTLLPLLPFLSLLPLALLTLLTLLEGIARPTPLDPPPGEIPPVGTPTTSPLMFMRAPPEFPGLIAASIWIILDIG